MCNNKIKTKVLNFWLRKHFHIYILRARCVVGRILKMAGGLRSSGYSIKCSSRFYCEETFQIELSLLINQVTFKWEDNPGFGG